MGALDTAALLDRRRALPYGPGVPISDVQAARRRALGRRVRETREAAGLSQAQLADRSKLARSYLGGVERGERNISHDALWAIADVFEATPAVFFLRSNQ